MAEKRSKRLARLVAVQRRLEEMAEADLAETNRERDRVRDAVEGTVGAMGSMDDVHLMFSRVYAVRIASLTMKDQRLQGLAGAQERRLKTERTRRDRLEERGRSADAAERRAEEDEDLYDLAERAGGTPRSSLP